MVEVLEVARTMRLCCGSGDASCGIPPVHTNTSYLLHNRDLSSHEGGTLELCNILTKSKAKQGRSIVRVSRAEISCFDCCLLSERLYSRHGAAQPF